MGVGQTQTCPESQAGGGALGLDLNRGYGESLRSSTLPGYAAACTAEPVRSQLHSLISDVRGKKDDLLVPGSCK